MEPDDIPPQPSPCWGGATKPEWWTDGPPPDDLIADVPEDVPQLPPHELEE